MTAQREVIEVGNGEVSRGKTRGLLSRLKDFTPMMAFMTLYLSAAAFNFGYDQGNFSGLQAMTYFDKQFGHYDEKKQEYALRSDIQSIMTSTPFLGKLVGCWVCAPLSERLGRRKILLIIALISYIGTSLQVSATTAAQFTVGRILLYFMTGFTVSVVPVYLAECSPPELRGLVGSQLQFQINFSIMIASFVNLGASKIDGNVQWKVTIAIGYLMPTVLLALWFKTKESPRWLVSRGRRGDAAASLRFFRKASVTDEEIENEIEIVSALGNEGKAAWKEVFQGTNKKRTAIACFVMFGQQITGQVFGSQYGTIFYKEQHIPHPFVMNTINTIVSCTCLFFTALILDSAGRRRVLLTGGALQAMFMFLLGGMGLIRNPSNSVKYLMVAFLILNNASYNNSWAPLSYLTVGEISNSRVREKAAMLAVSVSIATAFVVSFTLPYLMNDGYANLGPKVGFIYGSFAAAMVTGASFIVPELKGRTLEEVDELFETGIKMRKFRGTPVQSTTAQREYDGKLEVVEGESQQVEIAGK